MALNPSVAPAQRRGDGRFSLPTGLCSLPFGREARRVGEWWCVRDGGWPRARIHAGFSGLSPKQI